MPPGPPPAPAFSLTFPSTLSAFNVPVQTYQALHEKSFGIATGALVFDSRGRILLLQRAAHDSMPHRWEIPGGACDLDDETILHGLAREVWEESGLKVTAVVQQVGPDEGAKFFTRKGLMVCKYSFEVEVESAEVVTLDPNEHQGYLWVTEEECRSCKSEGSDGSVIEFKFTTPAQEDTVLEGFRLRKMAQKAHDSQE